MWQLVSRVLLTIEEAIIWYVGVINVAYFVFIALGFFWLRSHRKAHGSEERIGLLRTRSMPAISILVPVYNESQGVRDSVRSMLALEYSRHEVIVINDGSTDDTLEILKEEFDLTESERVVSLPIQTKEIRAIYESRAPIPLIVIDKYNGGKADALNAGINISRAPLIASVDADSILEPDALLSAVMPFVETPNKTVATGGMVRIINGCRISKSVVSQIGAPDFLLARFQTLEYLRAFLGGRIAFSFMNCLLLVSGAFGLFRKDVVTEVGGFASDSIGEDMELIVRIHKHLREKGVEYRIEFCPEPVCWTEVPSDLGTLYRQRNRWQRGTIDTLWRHREMLFNPKFGAAGIIGFPYFVLFEVLGPPIELAGYILTFLGLFLGFVSLNMATMFLVVSILFGICLSISALAMDEMTLRRFPAPGDVLQLLFAALIENLGYRQMMALWRTIATYDAFMGKKGWGKMIRTGFQSTPVQKN